MPQPDSFDELIDQLDAAFPDRLPRADRPDPAYIAAIHWRATGAREVIDWIKNLFVDPADLAVDADPDPDEET